MSTSTYLADWRTIAARIAGLEGAAVLHARFLSINSSSPYGVDKDLLRHCEDIQKAVVQFRETFQEVLPPAAKAAIDNFLGGVGLQITQGASDKPQLIRAIIVRLVAFASEMAYRLDSRMEHIRSATELAFMHLQRLIVVDGDYREKWKAAFATDEPHCEKLGAVHLLWHGIWAFKADAAGGRTDLVYQEPLTTLSATVTLGMVLTEWKRADPVAEAVVAFEAAREQAALYTSGVLAGVELATHRYLVVVSQQQIATPPDQIEGGIVYRHINIAVDPDTPSVAAPKLSRNKRQSRQ